MRVQWCGQQHHFIGKCEFHLATYIEDVLVSTVGMYRGNDGSIMEVGYRFYLETMVFPTDNDWAAKRIHSEEEAPWDVFTHPVIVDFQEMDRWQYTTIDAAIKGHNELVQQRIELCEALGL